MSIHSCKACTIAAIFTLTGCIGLSEEETDAVEAKLQVAMQALSSQQALGASPVPATPPASLPLPGKSSSDGFILTEARVNVRHIEIDLPEGKTCEGTSYCSDSNTIALKGPFLVDLLSGTSTPVVPEITIPAGAYKRLDIRLDDTEAGDGLLTQTDQLLDHTFLATGTFAYNGKADRKFTILLKFNEDARFETATGIELGGKQGQDLLLALDVGKWLEGVDLVGCLEAGDIDLDSQGGLVIDEKSGNGGCQGIEGILKENIKKSGIIRSK